MFSRSKQFALRIGAGVNPAVLISATAEAPAGWNGELTRLQVTDVKVIPAAGDLTVLRDTVADIDMNCDIDLDDFDIAVDCTTDPAFSAMSPATDFYSVLTGSAEESRAHGQSTIGRLRLLSNMKTLLSRRIISFDYNDDWPNVESALRDATARPPRQEESGLLVTDTTTADDIVIALSLLAWRAQYHRPVSQGAYNPDAFIRDVR